MECKWTTAAILAGAGVAGLAGGLFLGCKLGMRKKRRGRFVRDDAVGVFLRSHNVEESDVLAELRQMSMAHRYGGMTSALMSGKLLGFLCRTVKAKKVLDIGVFTGMSSFIMARALPEDGKVISCDISEEYTNLGRPYWKRGGVEQKIDLRIKPAVDTLQELIDAGEGETFDLVFIDANKEDYPRYFELGKRLLRSGGIFVVDNALWNGRVADPAVKDAETESIREINRLMRDDPAVEYVLLDICDGIILARKF